MVYSSTVIMTNHRHILIFMYISWLQSARTGADAVYIATPELQSVYREDSLHLSWMTSLPGRYILWCYWQHEVGTAWDRFLGYNNQESNRLNISARHQGWDFTNTASPCHGGIWREDAQRHHAGLYRMIIGLYNGTEYESPISDVIVAACQTVPDAPNADRLVTMTADHAVVKYTCHPGFPDFSENEAIAIQCIADSGQWSGSPPSCRGLSRLEAILIGIVVILCVFLVILVVWLLIAKGAIPFWRSHTDRSGVGGRGKADGSETTEIGENIPLKPHEPGHTADVPLVTVQPSRCSKWKPRRKRPSSDISQGLLEFIDVFPDMTVDLHKSLKLSVTVKSKSKPSATWKRSDELLTGSNEYKVGISGKNKFWLSLLKAGEEMSGLYSCVVTTKQGDTIEHSANILVIIEGMGAPKLVDPLEDPLVVQSGTTTTRTIVVHGNPLPKIVCYRDGVEMDNTDVITIDTTTTESDLTNVMITINQPKPADMCQLEIEACSQLGRVATGASLIVNCPPIVHKTLMDKTVGIGDDASFLVEIVAFPLPQVRWFKYDRGTKVPQHPGNEISDKYTISSELVLANCNPKDAGLILAEMVIDNITIATEQAMLNVRHPVKPQFITKLKPVTTSVGSDATFTVQYNGHPQPEIAWFMRDKPLEPSDRVQITFFNTNSSSLRIGDCSDHDSGDIRVTATNYLDMASCSTTLKVKERKPTFTMRPRSTRLIKGQSFTFQAEADGFPTPRIEWESGAKSKEDLTQGLGILTISAARTEHSGSYKVTAKNSAGSVSVEFTVTVVDESQNQAAKETLIS